MKLYDQHVHSRHSFDSRADPAGCVDQAKKRGLAGLTFAEHFDTHPDDWPGCVYNDESYSATIEALRTDPENDIFVGKGIEVCYQPDRMDFILDFLDRHSFDLVILSVHYFGEKAIFRRGSWDGLDAMEATRRYLDHVLDAVRFCERLHRGRDRVFDVLGHLDVVKRYTRRFFDRVEIASFADLVDEILRTCIAADLTPEINTSTLRQKLSEPMPGPETISRYAALGGKAMSLGSDAHNREDVGAGFDHAVGLMREAGIGHVALFERREKQLIGVE